jgi:uncharacterized Tic20 family protein
MDPITIIIVLILLGLAIMYKDAAAFIVMGVLLCIWIVVLLIAVSIASLCCIIVDGARCLKRN